MRGVIRRPSGERGDLVHCHANEHFAIFGAKQDDALAVAHDVGLEHVDLPFAAATQATSAQMPKQVEERADDAKHQCEAGDESQPVGHA